MNKANQLISTKSILIKLYCLLLVMILGSSCSLIVEKQQSQVEDSTLLPFSFDEIQKVQVKYLSSAPTAWKMRQVTKGKDIEKIYRCFDSLEEVSFDLSMGIVGGGVYNIDFILDDERLYHVFYHNNGAVNIYGFIDKSGKNNDQDSVISTQKNSVEYYKTKEEIDILLDGMTEYKYEPLNSDLKP